MAGLPRASSIAMVIMDGLPVATPCIVGPRGPEIARNGTPGRRTETRKPASPHGLCLDKSKNVSGENPKSQIRNDMMTGSSGEPSQNVIPSEWLVMAKPVGRSRKRVEGSGGWPKRAPALPTDSSARSRCSLGRNDTVVVRRAAIPNSSFLIPNSDFTLLP
jgi:hypothetical protein